MFFHGVDFSKDVGSDSLSEKELNVYHLIQAYRNYGHLEANLNPLTNARASSDQLALRNFNLGDEDMGTSFSMGKLIGLENGTLQDIVNHLKASYCGTLTAQFAEALPQVRDWFIEEFEKNRNSLNLDKELKTNLLKSLTKTESLEKFIHTRFVAVKRFSVEGADSLLPMLETLAHEATSHGGKEIIIGMAHRGRVNVLANFMGKALKIILGEFLGNAVQDPNLENYEGDVKYHLGYRCEKETPNGPCEVELAFNPSHLEAVNTVVSGMVRAAQRRRKDTEHRKTVIPLLIHGDAAFAGQGVVAETFQMSDVKGYTVGGTIHIVVDNQVGFTTSPENGRSSTYSSDLSKCMGTPVIHANGDDVEACVLAMDKALRFRQKFGKDVVINLTCYRRFGHNEGDEPSYTQPLMYDIIKKHPTPRELYGKRLMKEGVVDEAFYNDFYNEKINNLQGILDDAKANPPEIPPLDFSGTWKDLRVATREDFETVWETKVDLKMLKEVGAKISEVPKSFTPHRKVVKLLDQRLKMTQGEMPMDWGTAELLAYASLVKEGTPIRISGQDCVRGTFSHRHSKSYDIKTGEAYSPIGNLRDDVEFCVYDSILSEYGVLGFEYGNSICDPTFLTIWEAQFGDFANGAQITIDQFITSGEVKWQQMSGLVLLLPHGYEGQGPEHSSAKMERFLQMCAQKNIQVCNLTTPAQIFHALRRQVRRPFRKPLIVMSPKKLLRHPMATSTLDDLSKGHFQEIIDDSQIDAKKAKRVLFCSGKVYYDLLEKRTALERDDVAIIRVEQLYPFAEKALMELTKRYRTDDWYWVQEEPENMGGWRFFFHRFRNLCLENGKEIDLKYAGRTHRASPATGSPKVHEKEQNDLLNQAFE